MKIEVEGQENNPKRKSKEKKSSVVNSEKAEVIEKKDERYVKLNLPSNFVFYDFKELSVRKLNIRDAGFLSSAITNKSYRIFKDAVQRCIDQDVDVLTMGDFKYICYWLREKSFPKSPITVEWQSKYGNKLTSQVIGDNITTLVTDMTEESFKKWQERGFDVPRMKFIDYLNEDNIKETFLYEKALYFKGDTIEEKIDNLEKYTDENGLESVKDISAFDKELEHGVEEKIVVVDTKFDVNDYKKYLEDKIAKIRYTKTYVLTEDSEDYNMLELLEVKLVGDLEELNVRIASKEVIQAEPEEIFLKMGPEELLSPLLVK